MANSNAGTSGGNAGGGKYQVFLNFCGRDTRNGFTDFLYQELVENGIRVFMDDEELPVGEEIGGELLQAIDDSQIYIPIFSRNYARSKWCLRELVRMVNNISKSEEKKILPIFYDVEPKDVDLKTSLYTTAIEEHKKKFPDEGEYWEGALQKIDKIKGWEVAKCKSNAELMKLAVREVLHQLKRKYKTVTKELVGLDGPVREVLNRLDVNCSDVRLLGIYGMGGIGKTTLAKVIYNELHSRFEKCCAFLADVRETSKKEGLLKLQKNLLTEIVSSKAAEIINDVDYGRVRIEETLDSKKVLIVLDDVDDKKQIENLIGQCRLQPGTRVIITTRDTRVLEFIEQRMARETEEMNSDHAFPILHYEMKVMNFDDALQLFKRHAFVGNFEAKDFYSLSKDIVKSTGGLPLSVEVIGSLLFGKPKAKWEDTLNQLKIRPHQSVQEKLMISYEALNYCQCEIFLDIACFFINEDMTNAKYMWEACRFYPNLEIDVLLEMSLIKIRDNDKFWMHDQLRDLGREIVRKKNLENFEKRTRVWTIEEFLDFVRTKERTEYVEAIDLQGRSSHISISHEEIERFTNLRLLRLYNGTFLGDFIVSLPKLRWMSWSYPQLDCSAGSMHLKNLVVLELFNNKFTDDSKVWDIIKMATKLKSLAVVRCTCLTRTPDLSKCLSLERLTFDDCWRLKEIDSSIGKLSCLLDLNITLCELVEQVPNEIGRLVKLECFSLKRCYKVSRLPTSIGNLASLRKLDLSNTGITSLPDSIGKLRHLSDLCLKDTKIKQLPNSIGELTWLYTLDLSKHEIEKNIGQWELPKAIGMLDRLEELNLGHRDELVGKIPNEIGYLSSLRILDLCCTKISGLPGTINMLSRLSILDLSQCNEITELPELPASLVRLHVESRSLQVVPNLSKLTNLVDLVLSDGSDHEDSSNPKHKCDLGWIGRLFKLKKLKLCLLNIAAPTVELGPFSLLEDLTLCSLDLQPLKQLPPSLLSLELDNFSSTSLLLSNLKFLSILRLRLSQLEEIRLNGLSQLRYLTLEHCDLQSLFVPFSLRTLDVFNCPNMTEIQFIGMSASLEELLIVGCWSIGRVVLCGEGGSLGVLNQSESSSSELTYCSPGALLLTNPLKKLRKLELERCENLLEIQVIGTLSSLQDIFIKSCDAMGKLSGIRNLKNLHRLVICRCSMLRVVEGLEELEFLTFLDVNNCPSLETLLDLSNSNIPDKCLMQISQCRESLDSSPGGHMTFKHYKRMAQQGALQLETNKEEAKMEGDAKETDTELQLQFHPSTSSRDHEISEEPSVDKVRRGTMPGKQNQMTERDSNLLSLDRLGKQNHTTEQESNPLSLDKLAPPRTFCDRFKTCLVSIFECICNRELS